MIVMDEYTRPSMRETFSTLMSISTHVDMAVAHMRIAGMDLRPGEAGKLQRLRMVIGKLDADALLQTHARPIDQLERLRSFATSGILQVRLVPRFQWTPDFSLFSGGERAMMIGAHYSAAPYPSDGIALTCVVNDANAVRRCAARYERMWQLGYDVLPVVIEMLDQLLSEPACV